MGRKVKQLKNYTTEQVEKLLESDENYRIVVKLFAVLLLTRGYSSRALEKFFLTSFKQICNWADRFDAEGVKGLRIKQGRGRRSRLTVQQRVQLKADLSKSPKEFDYHSVNWSGALIKEHISKMYQVEYKQSAVYYLMHQIGFSFIPPSQAQQ
jgi:transposase